MLKGVFNYLSSSAVPSTTNDFVGQVVELGNYRLNIKRVIAEGGFAFVFVAQDQSGKEYALKRLLAIDKQANDTILQEINFLKKLSGHENIIQFVQAASVQADSGRMEYLLLTELCKRGPLIDVLRKMSEPLSVVQILQIFYQSCRATQHMHFQRPPIIHRDLKIENLLLDSSSIIKLCDFGSATTDVYIPDDSWTGSQRTRIEEEMARHTTPIYRAPELLDLYSNYIISTPIDIWALGCMLYYLCYNQHAFPDGAKLPIINGKYNIPENDNRCAVFHDLIFGMLQVDPRKRPLINDVLERLEEMAHALRVASLSGPVCFNDVDRPVIPPTVPSRPTFQSVSTSNASVIDRNDRQGQDMLNSANIGQSGQMSGIFRSLRGEAGSLFKNLKDTSTKVMQTVQASINKTDLDLSYLTNRVAVMSFPAEGIESAYRNHIDEVARVLDSRHGEHYAVYNFTNRSYRIAKFHNRVYEFGWLPKRTPTLHNVFAVWKNINHWLRQNQENTAIIHCFDGRGNSAYFACVLFLICRLFDDPERALRFFNTRRGPPDLEPSNYRYLGYVEKLCADIPYRPHNRPIKLLKLLVYPVPLFNKIKTGCRPFVQVLANEKQIFTSADDFERMRQWESHEGQICIPLNVAVLGDILVGMYHARSTLGTKVQGKLTAITIFQFQFHTGFLDEHAGELTFEMHELDCLDEADRYPSQFRVKLELAVAIEEEEFRGTPPAYYMHSPNSGTPKILFQSKQEREAVIKDFCRGQRCERLIGEQSSSQVDFPSPNAAIDSVNKQHSQNEAKANSEVTRPSLLEDNANFFHNLNWTQSANQEPLSALNIGDTKAEMVDRVDGIHIDSLIDEKSDVNQGIENDILNLLNWSENTNSNQRNRKVVDESVDLFSNNVLTTASSTAFDPFEAFADIPSSNANNTYTHNRKHSQDDFFGMVNRGGSAQSKDANLLFETNDLNFLSADVSGTIKHASSTSNLAPQFAIHRNISTPSFAQPGTNIAASPPVKDAISNQKHPPVSSGTPIFSRPNYSSSNFTAGFSKQMPKPPAQGTFDELLQSQGFSFQGSKGPSTLSQMKRANEVQDLDEDTVKIRDWTDGKRRNIRALLCSLHTVMWEDNEKWAQVNMSQLLTAAQVKKFYRKACLAVHPDKLTGTAYEELAKAIFTELNDAWNEFESSGQQNLMAS